MDVDVEKLKKKIDTLNRAKKHQDEKQHRMETDEDAGAEPATAEPFKAFTAYTQFMAEALRGHDGAGEYLP